MRALREDGRYVRIENCDERVQEFKRRLINQIGNICCDVKDTAPTGQPWNAYMDSLSPEQLKVLAHNFRMQLKQVIFAVKELK
jgi:hypothetical protein